jgi:hypothetical protein
MHQPDNANSALDTQPGNDMPQPVQACKQVRPGDHWKKCTTTSRNAESLGGLRSSGRPWWHRAPGPFPRVKAGLQAEAFQRCVVVRQQLLCKSASSRSDEIVVITAMLGPSQHWLANRSAQQAHLGDANPVSRRMKAT